MGKFCQVKPKGQERSFGIVTLSQVNSECFILELNSGPQAEKAYYRFPQLYTSTFRSFEENLFVALVTFDRNGSLFNSSLIKKTTSLAMLARFINL